MSDESRARVEALRHYLATAPQEELDARTARVKALKLPSSPTLAELLRHRQLCAGDAEVVKLIEQEQQRRTSNPFNHGRATVF